uniref:Putative secreted protein n=1 Tax=Ixodes ricinus TaxID=34613 RepID=V5IDC7_IXORI
MACLGFIMLAFVLAYQCVGVVNGDADENSLPGFVASKYDLFQKLRGRCEETYGTRIVGRVDLPRCRLYCARGAFWGIFGSSEVILTSNEPCSNSGGVCQRGLCVYYS